MIIFVAPGELEPLKNKYYGRWLTLCNILIKKKLKAKIITSNFIHSTKDYYETKDELFTVFNCGGYEKNISFKRQLYNAVFCAKVLRWMFLNRVGLKGAVIVFNSIPPELAITAYFSRLFGAKVVVDVRDLWPEALGVDKNKSMLFSTWSFYAKTLTYWILNQSITQYYTSGTYEKVLDKNKMKFTPLGVDSARWDKSNQPEINSDNSRLILGYIGNNAKQYNLSFVFDAMKSSRHLLKIIGLHPVEVRRQYPWVDFMGYMKGTNVIDETNNWHIAILPDMTYSGVGLPNKMYDYLGAKLPIIVFKKSRVITELDRYIVDNKIGDIYQIQDMSFDKYMDSYILNYKSYLENVLRVRRMNARSTVYDELSSDLIKLADGLQIR